MKLYIFEHCPYCVKAMMMVQYKNLNVPFEYIQNHDVDARIEKVGANMVPILEKDDGSYMPESLDIVAYLDKKGSGERLTDAKFAAEIKEWQDKMYLPSARLMYPRWMMIELPEFQSEEAKAWFTRNKTKSIGMSFEDAVAQTDEQLAELNTLFSDISWLELPSERGNRLSYVDIYPMLRNLTVVKGVKFPSQVRQYIEEVTALTGITLFDAVAV